MNLSLANGVHMNGFDISSYQSGIDVRFVPCDFVIVKATQGNYYTNSDFSRACQNTLDAGKLLGVYHYAGGGGAESEAQYFLDTVGGYLGTAILVLDWESNQNPNFDDPDYAKAFLDYVYRNTGHHPLIYMSKSVCREYDWSDVANSNYGLWAAQYASMDPTGYQDDPWTDSDGFGAWSWPAIYQYSSNGWLSGYDAALDLDIAYMNADGWRAYAAN